MPLAVVTTTVPTSESIPKSEEKDFWNAWLPAASKTNEEIDDVSQSKSKTKKDLPQTTNVVLKSGTPGSSSPKLKPEVGVEGELAGVRQDKEEENVGEEESSSWSFGWSLESGEEGKTKTKLSTWSDFQSGRTNDRGERAAKQGKEKKLGVRKSPRTSLSSSSSLSGSADLENEEKGALDLSQSVTASSLSDLPGTLKSAQGEPYPQKDQVVQKDSDSREDQTAVPAEPDLKMDPHIPHDVKDDLQHRDGEDDTIGEKKVIPQSGFDVEIPNVSVKDEHTHQEPESSISDIQENIVDSSTVIVEPSASNKDSQNSFTDLSCGSIPDSPTDEIVYSSNAPSDGGTVESIFPQSVNESLPVSDSQLLPIQVDTTVAMSTSESSILTLSSPGQGEVLEGQTCPESTIHSMESDYLSVSGPAVVCVPSVSSAQSTVSIQSFSSDQSVSSMKELADVSGETYTAEKEVCEQTDTDQSNGNESSDTSKLDSSMDTCTSGDTVLEKGDHEDSGSENEKSDNNLRCMSLNGSYVKCMLEDAMEEKPEDSGSDHHSTGEKSESSKFESEVDKSVSGHESSDDIETTTSSDIEIISTPNGDSYVKPFDLSPLRIALQKTASHSGHLHRRTDSQSSGSTYSKTGESDQLSPGRDSLERLDQESGDEGKSRVILLPTEVFLIPTRSKHLER